MKQHEKNPDRPNDAPAGRGADKAPRSRKGKTYFPVPAIHLDRQVYPAYLGLSPDALRLYLLHCSCVNRNGLHFTGAPFAEKCLGLGPEEYKAANKELLRNGLVFRYYPAPKHGEDGSRKRPKCYCVSVPPLLDMGPDGKLRFAKPSAEPKSGLSAAFHRGNRPFNYAHVPIRFARSVGPEGKLNCAGPLKYLSADEIECALHLYWQCRDYWLGVNPNWVRLEMSLARGPVEVGCTLGDYLCPAEGVGDTLCVSPAFVDRAGRSEAELAGLIKTLVDERHLFRWRFWVAERVTYHDEKRGIKMQQIKLRWCLDPKWLRHSAAEVADSVRQIVGDGTRYMLVGQLCSVLPVSDDFEQTVEVNCAARSVSKLLGDAGKQDCQGRDMVDASSDAGQGDLNPEEGDNDDGLDDLLNEAANVDDLLGDWDAKL